MALSVVPVVLVVVAVPLILNKVPPNGLYGFRTPKTLSSPAVWYPANRRSGIYFALAGAAMLILQTLLRAAGWSPEKLPGLLLAIVLIPIGAALAASFAYLRKL